VGDLCSRSFRRRWIEILDVPFDNPSAVTRSFNQRNIYTFFLRKLFGQRRGLYPTVFGGTSSAFCTVFDNFFSLWLVLVRCRSFFIFLRLCCRGFPRRFGFVCA